MAISFPMHLTRQWEVQHPETMKIRSKGLVRKTASFLFSLRRLLPAIPTVCLLSTRKLGRGTTIEFLSPFPRNLLCQFNLCLFHHSGMALALPHRTR
jgi:hypothetical protein